MSKTIEEKAIAYDKAIEKAREYWETDNDNTLDIKAKGTMEYLFPELAESEDEKIRKEILEVAKTVVSRDGTLYGKEYNCREWIAWLEKQEQKPTDEDMKEALRTEYEKGRADAFAQMQKEWSEEDEKRLKSCLCILQPKTLLGNTETINTKWLKSIRNRITWKPNEEQMRAFEQMYDWYNTHFAQSLDLNSLYNNLKKLKGE